MPPPTPIECLPGGEGVEVEVGVWVEGEEEECVAVGVVVEDGGVKEEVAGVVKSAYTSILQLPPHVSAVFPMQR